MAFDFEFSAEQEALRASVRRFLDDQAPLTHVREQWADPVGTTDEVWRGLAEIGTTGLLVEERYGGTAAGMVSAGAVLEELGRAVHPGPFVSTAITVPALLRESDPPDDAAALLAGIADGSRRATAVAARPTPIRVSGDVLTGTVEWVRDAAAVDTLVVLAQPSDETDAIFFVDAADARIDVTPTVDGSSSFAAVTFDGTPARPVPTGDVAAAVDAAQRATLVARTVQGVGTAARALELAVEYAKDRRQFGRPIGSFQAVQHLCADMLVDLELARAGAYYALWAEDEAAPDDARMAARLAKAWASDALARVGASAIQVFGGIGYTWEHDIHLFYKRLLTLQHDGGGTSVQLEALAAALLD